MVNGIEQFRTFFSQYKEQYVLIGGAACDIFFEESATAFRATKDLDVVLIVEALTPEFGKAFWSFLQAGGYRNKCKSGGKPQFYRFDKPETEGYPYMLELFSKETFQLQDIDSHLTPLHFSDEISSLSAILLNEVYYNMLLAGRMELNQLVVLAPLYIVPFKAKAWLDMSEKKKQGMQIDDKDIRKHKNDIIRLLMILPGDKKAELTQEVREDMKQFITHYKEEPVSLKTLGIAGVTNEALIKRLEEIYL